MISLQRLLDKMGHYTVRLLPGSVEETSAMQEQGTCSISEDAAGSEVAPRVDAAAGEVDGWWPICAAS